MSLEVTVQEQACGALVSGVDLSAPLTPEQSAELRTLWLQHLVLGFPINT
jgi:taurine dioxygenase